MERISRHTQKEQTKTTILKAAYDLFSERGIRNTRMSDIAQASGVSHGTVFLHFKTQEALIAEVVETYCGKIALRTHEMAGNCGSLRELLEAHLEGIETFESFYTALVVENRTLPKEVRDTWVNLQSAISFHFSEILEKDPPQKPGIPTDILFNLWIGLVHHYLANGDLFAPEGHVIRRYRRTLVENYLMLVQNGGTKRDGGL